MMDFNAALDAIEGVTGKGVDLGGEAPAYPDFPLDEYRLRYARVRTLMELVGADVLVLTQEESIRYLTGYDSMIWIAAAWLPATLVIPRDAAEAVIVNSLFDAGCTRGTSWVPTIDAYADPSELPSKVGAHVRRLAGAERRVALETGVGSTMLMPWELASRLVDACGPPVEDASRLLSAVRMIKSDAEIERLRAAAQAAVAGYADALGSARAGMTEAEVMTRIGAVMYANGATPATKPLFLNGVAGADRYVMADAPGSRRRLADGDLMFLDGGGPSNGYMSDIIRIAAVGDVPPDAERYMEAAEAAATAMREGARPGPTASELFEAGLAAYRERGLEQSAGSLFGHGIGLEIWERPFIRRHDDPRDDIRLREGMTICLEPMLVPVENGRIRGLFVIEDMVALTANGAEVLSDGLDRSLARIPRAT
jgi:Xaa-Pro aminopeptidase